jgi:hypothetical protein
MPADAWKPRFLASLRASGIVGVAAEEAGVSRRSAYAHRERDWQFRAEWDAALEDGVDNVLLKRAFDLSDPDNPNYDAKVASRVLQFLLRGYRPEGFREPQKPEVLIVKFDGYERRVVFDPDGTSSDLDNFTDAELRLIDERGFASAEDLLGGSSADPAA